MAKRMVLVDERMFNQLWKRTPTDVSKSDLNSQMQVELDTIDLPDDVKAKQYQKTLSRFLSLKQQVPNLPPAALNGLKIERAVHKIRKKTKSSPWVRIPTRASKRKHIPWTRYE